ncbi:MAG: signal peptidase II [Clostridiaceae bacterium]|jgi:signal peptidase II|nr:signal peptidase II [Clostridiaceae bacterium]
MLWIIIPIIVVAIDQLTKYIVVKNIEVSQMIPVIDDFFYLTLHKNTGGAWGILQNSRLLFLILIPVVSVFLVYYIVKNNNRFLRFTLALILGGAIGNYIDRVAEGAVTDFLLFYIGSYPFPIFNAADIAVTCGTILLAVYVLFIYKEPQKAKQDEKNEE